MPQSKVKIVFHGITYTQENDEGLYVGVTVDCQGSKPLARVVAILADSDNLAKDALNRMMFGGTQVVVSFAEILNALAIASETGATSVIPGGKKVM